jgi:hypothetical protein
MKFRTCFVHVRLRQPDGLADATTVSFAAIVAVFFVYVSLAATIFPRAFIALLTADAPTFMAVLFPYMALVLALRSVAISPEAPLGALRRLLRERGALLAAGTFAFPLGITTFKINMPYVVPFYADPVIARLDGLLHGGNPWDVVYAIPHEYALLIDFMYTGVWPALLLGIYSLALAYLHGRMLLRYLWSLLFVYIILGGVVATASSSAGPIFWTEFYPADEVFLQMKGAIMSNPHIGNIALYAQYLLENYRDRTIDFGTGISAFPSIHVAVAALTAWVLTSLGRCMAVAGWAYACIIEYGSIYSGWHYGLDGYVSLIAVSLCWVGLSRFYGLPLLPRRLSKLPNPNSAAGFDLRALK